MIVWRTTDSCDPATRNGRRRIARGYLHADKGEGKSFCGSLPLGDYNGERPKCERCAWILRRLALKAKAGEEAAGIFRKNAKALFAILNVLAVDGVVVVQKDGLPFECLSTRDGVLKRTPVPHCLVLKSSRLQWVAMRFRQSPVIVI